jgi:hypothetical protein
MSRAFVLMLMLALGCASSDSLRPGYRTSDPLEALHIAGTAALTAPATPPPASRDARRNPDPPRSPPPPLRHVDAPAPQNRPAAPATIDGYVISDESGWPIALAVVKLAHEHGPWVRVRADPRGQFHVPPPLASGHYVLDVTDERWAGRVELDLVAGVAANVWIKVRARPQS